MYSGELEVQAKRKAIAILQDEINRILNATRELASLPGLIIKNDKQIIKNTIEQILSIEDEIENLRKKITREISDVGGLIINRESLLNAAYTMDGIGECVTDISFKISIIKTSTLKNSKCDKELSKLMELLVDEVYKLNEMVRNLNTDSNSAIGLSYEIQTIEKDLHIKYRLLATKIINNVPNSKELLIFKDVVDCMLRMSDKCEHVSDLFILLALN